jgi:hypothetical protein
LSLVLLLCRCGCDGAQRVVRSYYCCCCRGGSGFVTPCRVLGQHLQRAHLKRRDVKRVGTLSLGYLKCRPHERVCERARANCITCQCSGCRCGIHRT